MRLVQAFSRNIFCLVCVATLALACAARPKQRTAPRVLTRATASSSTRHGLAASPAPPPAASRVRALAFPGALGWAAYTPGGRGGRVLRVTTLSASGPGSLQRAIATPGRRIIVFEVGGVIDLGRRFLSIQNPYLTIAGQTAPSPGITIIKGGLRIFTHDVIVQHLRIRPGTAGAKPGPGWQPDAITTLGGAHDVIIDHCSTTWSIDENLSASGPRFAGKTPAEWRRSTSHRITLSHNIIAEALSHSVHPKGEHSKGTLLHDNVTGVVIARNLYFSNASRNPQLKGGVQAVIANNLISNPKRAAIHYGLAPREWRSRRRLTGELSVVGNVLRYGPSTNDRVPLLLIAGAGRCKLYLGENLLLYPEGRRASLLGGNLPLFQRVASPPAFPPQLPLLKARDVVDYLRRNVGAQPWDRDAIDARIVAQAISGNGRIIDHEDQVEGYPAFEPSHAPFIETDWNLETMRRRQ